MRKKFLLLLALLFLLAGVIFVLPAVRDHAPDQTKESATEETESTTETESETPTETETESETETEETTEEETEGPGDPVDREKVETHLIIASDTHYMSTSMTDYGAAFDSLVNSNDGKVIRYQPQLWQAFKSEVLAANPDALILSGDLSLNGEKANHLEFSEKLHEIEEAGVPVYVIPGNHDINKPDAGEYFGDQRTDVESVTSEEFREIYADFGYNEAKSGAPDSLSYLVELNDTTWLMMLDTTVCEPENEVYGEIKEETLEWMEECMKAAYAEGITVIPVGHHNLQRLSRVYVEECVIENCDEVLELFERYLTPVYFSGHLHTQKVMKHLTEPGMDSDTYGIWEIVSNSLILPPCQYGIVTLNTDGSIDYMAKTVDVSSWAAANGETDENLLDFSSYTKNYLQTVLKNQIARKLEDVPKELREVMVDFYTDLYKDYYAGVPISYSEKKNEFGYGLWVRYMDPSTEFRQLDGMMRDSISANNHAEIPNPIHLKRP